MTRWILAAAALSVVTLGCDGGVDRDAQGRVVSGGELSVFELRTGDCFDGGAADEEVTEVDVVPCEEPHDHEVFALLEHPAAPGEPFPGRDELVAFGESLCVERFAAYVGEPYQASELEISLLPPQEGSWVDRDDRIVVCVLRHPDRVPLTGSRRG